MEVTWRDIWVDVGWGRLAGKTCITGDSETIRLRVVGLHGWLDNANTFDTLVPLIPAGIELLVFDLPGHGHSDHLPLGAQYNILAYAFNVRTAVLNYGWEKFVVLGHSMGSVISVYFIAHFPEHVSAFITLDLLQPGVLKRDPNVWRLDAIDLMKAEKLEGQRTTVYNEEEAIERMVAARNKLGQMPAIDEDAAYVLLPRSAQKVEGGYKWTHDPKARPLFSSFYALDNWMAAVSSIKCPVLLVRASHGVCPKIINHDNVISAYNHNAMWFDVVNVEGSHHVHLTQPDNVAPGVSLFINKVMSRVPQQLSSKL